MATKVGIDLVCTEEVRDSLAALGRRYIERVYTEAEQAECGSDPSRLASRFAAKEATIKALSRHDTPPLGWRSIGLERVTTGRPTLKLTGEAEAYARQRGVESMSVSLTRHRSGAAAIVVIELRET
jgi:holo-[acyl-carrier protein] synthase